VNRHASRRPGGAVHRGMVHLLRHQTRWVVELLIAGHVLPTAAYAIETLPTETWPVGEENRAREIRADVVLRLWRETVPEDPSLELIRASDVIGLILDYQDRREAKKELRLLEYDSAYPPILGPQVYLVVLTLDEAVARWMRNVLARKHLIMHTCVLSPKKIPRSGPIDARAKPRRALLEAMLHVRDDTELVLMTNALRALRCFEGNELLIYQQMLLSRMKEALIMQAQQELEPLDDDTCWDDYVLTEDERECFYYVRGQRAGHEAGHEEGLQEGLSEGRAQTLLELLRLRGLEIDASSQATILACRDTEQLTVWLARALTATGVDELFEPR
jgi:hypothetical protein